MNLFRIALHLGLIFGSLIQAEAVERVKNPTPNRVAVIGAGLAGLTAAYKMEQGGLRSDIFEAQNRIGGRVRTKKLEDLKMTVETGGTFIDSSHLEIRRLAADLGVELVRMIGPQQFLHYQVFRGGVSLSTQNFEKFSHTLLKWNRDRLGLRGADVQVIDRLKGISLLQYLHETEASAELIFLCEAISRNEFGSELTELNASTLFEMVDFDLEKKYFQINGALGDEADVLRGGSDALLHAFRERLQSPIFQEYILKSITERSDHAYDLSFDTPDGAVVRTYSNVVVTIPIPVIREQVRMNVPNLRPEIRSIVDRLQAGKNAKLLLYFSEPLWLHIPHGDRFTVITQNFWIWENGDDRLGNPFYGLTAYAGGQVAASLNSVSDQDRVDSILTDLERVIPQVRRFFLRFERGDLWHMNPYARGSHLGGFTPKERHLEEWMRSRSIFHDRGLVFAGEGWDAEYMGFMNGAVRSGQNAAEHILRSILVGAAKVKFEIKIEYKQVLKLMRRQDVNENVSAYDDVALESLHLIRLMG